MENDLQWTSYQIKKIDQFRVIIDAPERLRLSYLLTSNGELIFIVFWSLQMLYWFRLRGSPELKLNKAKIGDI